MSSCTHNCVSSALQWKREFISIIGFFLSATCFLLGLYVLLGTLLKRDLKEREARERACCCYYKTVICVFVMVYCLLEIPYNASQYLYANQWNNLSTWGYVSRLFGVFLLNAAFGIFLNLWVEMLELEKKEGRMLMGFIYVFIGIFGASTLFLIGRLVTQSIQNVLYHGLDIFYMVYLFTSAGVFFVISLCFLRYSCRLRRRVMSLPYSCRARRPILMKLVLVIIICTLLYALRLVMAGVLYYGLLTESGPFYPSGSNTDYGDDHPIIWMSVAQYLPEYGIMLVMCFMLRPLSGKDPNSREHSMLAGSPVQHSEANRSVSDLEVPSSDEGDDDPSLSSSAIGYGSLSAVGFVRFS